MDSYWLYRSAPCGRGLHRAESPVFIGGSLGLPCRLATTLSKQRQPVRGAQKGWTRPAARTLAVPCHWMGVAGREMWLPRECCEESTEDWCKTRKLRSLGTDCELQSSRQVLLKGDLSCVPPWLPHPPFSYVNRLWDYPSSQPPPSFQASLTHRRITSSGWLGSTAILRGGKGSRKKEVIYPRW